jgi:3-oxoacyl-[acyl-carrier-protein] synthase-3
MSKVRFNNVRLKGVASAVPAQVRTLEDDKKVFNEAEVRKISASTGVMRRHIVSPGVCTSDLCLAAAEPLLAAAGWGRETVDVLVFVSQTPDYVLPATSCSLHSRLQLSKNCAAFDVNLLLVYLWTVAGRNLIAAGGASRALVMVGDTINS